jgi:hypothetical protein
MGNGKGKYFGSDNSFEMCVKSWLRWEFERRSVETIFSNKPQGLFEHLRRSAVQLRKAKCRLKNTTNPKTGSPYARNTIKNYKSDVRSWADNLAENKTLVKLGVAAGFIGRGPKTDFERVAGILLKLYIESKAELAAAGLSEKAKANRSAGARMFIDTALPVKLAAAGR